MLYNSPIAQGARLLDAQPAISGSSPADGAININRGAFIRLDVQLIDGRPIDLTTLNVNNVKVARASDNQFVNTNLNTDAGGAVIVITPSALLAANTRFVVSVTSGLKDAAGNSFAPFSTTFTTGEGAPARDSNIVFKKTNQSSMQGYRYTGLAWGPDNKLYAGTEDGQILRFEVGPDGTLGAAQVIHTVDENNPKNQIIIGMEFDPAATASNPILWISHSTTTNLDVAEAPD